jgi:peptidyl-prolyl cis-trans isomerase SurA
VFVAGILMALAIPGLAACRTSPTVAAYVGDQQVSLADLDSAIAAREADPAVAKAVGGDQAGYTRKVLGALILEHVYAAAAQHYGVSVSDAEVRTRIAGLLAGYDPKTVYAQLAAQGISKADVFESQRQLLLRQRIADAAGKGSTATEAQLRARYEQVKPTLAKYEFGYIAVPNQATATAVLAQLTAKPGDYAAVAAKYPGQVTLPATTTRTASELPQPLVDGITKAKPNTGFTVPLDQAGGVVVCFVVGVQYPTFEQERASLEQEAGSAADAAAAKLVSGVEQTLHVTVNPRFGAYKDGKLDAVTSGVVKVLPQAASAGSAPSSSAGPATGGN